MLCRRGENDIVDQLDFGVVKSLELADTRRDLTKALKILSTPRFAASERLLNPSDVDARSDRYAYGAVGYIPLTGRSILEGDDSFAISNQALHTPADAAAQPESSRPQRSQH